MSTKTTVRLGVLIIVALLASLALYGARGEAEAPTALTTYDSVGATLQEGQTAFETEQYLKALDEQNKVNAYLTQLAAQKAAQRAALARQQAARKALQHRATPVRATAVTGSGRCGGDLPPCWVMRRESGGNINAYNPTGCSGRGCYGKWQCDPRTCSGRGTEEQQDAEARALWNGGKGCQHWAAC